MSKVISTPTILSGLLQGKGPHALLRVFRPPNSYSMLRVQRVVDTLVREGDFSGIDDLIQQARDIWGDGHDPDGEEKVPERPVPTDADDAEMIEKLDSLGCYSRPEKPGPTLGQSEARQFLQLTETTVYFAESSTERQPIKIGHSRNPHSRMGRLHYVVGDFVELLCTLPGGRLREMHLHSRFSKYRISGEWFVRSEEIVDYIKEVHRGRA